MKKARWMVAACVGSWLAAAVFLDRRTAVDVLIGMVGPLVVVSGSWVLTERTYRRTPDRLTAMMVTAFVGKMIVFGAYVAVMLGVLALRPVPFVASFTGYFIALYLAEALCLRRLLAGG